MSERDDELSDIAEIVREHVEWEALLGGAVVPASFAPMPAGGKTGAGSATPVSAGSGTPSASNAVSDSASNSVSDSVSNSASVSDSVSVPASASDRRALLSVLATEVSTCTRCRLHEKRTRTVFARGSENAEIAFVGEGPGYNEDQQGLPFVGAAGQLLDKMIGAMGYGRDEVYVCNVVKCRPPENRTPLPDEAATCEPFLTRQLEVVAPKVIIALGRCAAENLGCAEPGRSWRGSWGSWRGVPVMATYHPAYLLRSPEMKRPVWEDLQKVMARLGRDVPSRKG